MHHRLKRTWLAACFILPCLFTLCKGFSQTPTPAFELRDDTAWKVEVPSDKLLHFADSTGGLSIEEIMKLAREGRMYPLRSNPVSTSDLSIHHWLYFRLTNKTDGALETAIRTNADIARFHVVRANGKIESTATGRELSWEKKTEFFNHNFVPFKMAGEETVEIYCHIQFLSSENFFETLNISLTNPDKFARHQLKIMEPLNFSDYTTTRTLFSGMFLLAAIIYFVFYALVKERVFLLFALFLLCQGIAANHFIIQLGRYRPELNAYSFFIWEISFLILLLFLREFLDTKKYQPLWDKFLLVFTAVTAALLFLLEFFRPGLANAASLYLLTCILLVMILVFLLPGAHRKKEKKFLFYAILPVLSGFGLFFLVISSVSLAGGWSEMSSRFPVLNSIGEFLSDTLEIAILWLIISFSRLLFRRFSEQRQKIREQELEKERILQQQELERLSLIERQKIELEKQVAERTAELKKSIEELKATQAQLIQSEKMASLGEMTAGIAHEIQNPLNFVNNFAEVNAELADEINEEMDNAVPDPAQRNKMKMLLNDLKLNETRIREHGKRADGIVKNMLQHSRTSSEKKEEVSFNALVDEYVKLSYHGFKGRDKSFNAHFETQLDPGIGSVDLLPQDFGRVVLNLVNNAFYAVREKARNTAHDYAPSVSVKTERMNGTVRLTVSDNGNGIPASIREKIFQPFFTTKPTGEGTGLGLSISYDIITKGHGGAMSVESLEGEGSSFVVTLPA